MVHLSPRVFGGASLLLAAAVAAGCATTKPPSTPQEEYRQAVAQAQRGHYLEAQHLFESVRDADTPVRLELLAEVGIADALYKEGKFEEAAQAYNKLLTVHSGDAIADYLNYQLGMCFYRRIDTVDRDQGLTRQARSQFMALITRYPESDLVPAAREKLQACNDYLARRELYVGRFYLERGNYKAAKARFARGLTRYGKVAVIPDLLHDLCLAQDGLGEREAADHTASRLRHDFPSTPAATHLAEDRDEARVRREGGGPGPLRRLERWWSRHHGTPAGTETGEEAAPSSPSTPPDAAPPPAVHETAPAPSPPAEKGAEGGDAAPDPPPEPHTGLDPEAPWPGSTVATDPTCLAKEKASPEAEEPHPSRWAPLLSWLHRRGAPREEVAAAPREPPAPPAPSSTPGLIIRRIPPVREEAAKGGAAATALEAHGAPPSAIDKAHTAAPPAPGISPAPPRSEAPAVPSGPRASGAPEGTHDHPAAPPIAPVRTVMRPAAASPPAHQRHDEGSRDLVVEEFPALETGAPAPASHRQPSLAERVAETLDGPAPVRPQGVAATTPRLPAPAPPTQQPLVASGEALRHDVPRPLPRPPFTRPAPPLPGESLPPALAGGDTREVEWRAMSAPPAAHGEETAATPAAPSSETAAPAARTTPLAASGPEAAPGTRGGFWDGVRERFSGATAAAE